MVSQLPAQQREEEKGDLLTGDNNTYIRQGNDVVVSLVIGMQK